MATKRRSHYKSSPTKTKARSSRGATSKSFDLIPGTKVDEYLAPWILALAVIPGVGLIAHAWWGHGLGRALAPILIVSGGALLTWVAWHDAAPRKPLVRWRVAVTVAAAFAGIAVTTVAGLVSINYIPQHTLDVDIVRPWFDIQLIVGCLIATSWNVLRTEAVRGYGDDQHDATPAGDSLAESLGIGGTRAKVVSDDGTRKVIDLVHRGHTAKDVQDATQTLASLAGVPATGVRVTPDREDAGKSSLVLVSRDVLASGTSWPGLSAPGESCSVPCRIGVREDASTLTIVRPGDDAAGRPSVSVACQGMPGAGKTEGVLDEVVELVSRRDVVIWWSDTIKSAQTVPAFRPAIDYLATTVPETKQMIRSLDHVIRARVEAFGEHGYRQWSPEVYDHLGIPYLVVYLEESARVMEDIGEVLTRATEAIRSAGISLNVSMQRQSGSNMPTDMRFNLGMGWCFGVKNPEDAPMVLSDDTIEGGARPEAWAAAKPGSCYLEATHVPPDQWAMPTRTYRLLGSQMREVVAEWAPRMARLDAVSARAAGGAYAGRDVVSVEQWLRETGPVPVRRETTVPRPRLVSIDQPGDDNRDETGDDGLGDDIQEARAMLPERDEEIRDAMETADPRRDITVPGDHPAVLADFRDTITPGVRLDPAAADAAFSRIVAQHLNGSQDGVIVRTASLLDAWLDLPGMTLSQRPALTRRIRKLVDDGLAEDLGRGKWRILPGAEHVSAPTDGDDDEATDQTWSVGAAS